MPGNEMIALYIRLSVEDGDLDDCRKKESNSILHQRMLLHEFVRSRVELKNCPVQEFCDDGYSGTNFHRPGFQEMMRMVKLKKIGCIIVKDLSRFGRDYLEVSSYLELILPVFDIRFLSVNDHFDSNDYRGTTGGMELAFRNLINGMYSKDISVKVKSARKTRERRGEYLNGVAFYGYRRDPADRHHLLVDEEVRWVVKAIFTMCAQGMSTTKIAKRLNEQGIPCPVEYKKVKGISYSKKLAEEKAVWIQSTVRKIIRDERYTGKMVSNVRSSTEVGKNMMKNNPSSEWIIVEDTHEGIVDEALYQEANLALSARMKARNENTNWKNSGNLFVCGCCGRKLQKSKGKDRYLYCLKASYSSEGECGKIHEEVDQVERCVVAAIKKMGQAMSDGAQIRRKGRKEDIERLKTEKEGLNKQLQKHKAEKGRMYEQYKGGQMTKEEFLDMQKRHQERREVLEREIQRKEDEISIKEKEQEAMQQVQAELRTAEILTEYDPKLVGQIVEKVIVHVGGKVELVMRNRDSYAMVFGGDGEIED